MQVGSTGLKLLLDDQRGMTLEDAYRLHAGAFDPSCKITLEELIVILERCRLFDELFTPLKAVNHFKTWADGCNQACPTRASLDEGIGYPEFEMLLQWAADVKCVDFAGCVRSVVRMSSKLCDKSASTQRRLEVVFDAFGRLPDSRMSATDFSGLCRKLGVRLCNGDIFWMFSQEPGGLRDGIDYGGFVNVLKRVGAQLGVQDQEVFDTFARGVEVVSSSGDAVARLRTKLQQAAQASGETDWRVFLRTCGARRSGLGKMEWQDFYRVCRERLRIGDRDSNLKILFERLDVDGHGELDIEKVITSLDAAHGQQQPQE